MKIIGIGPGVYIRWWWWWGVLSSSTWDQNWQMKIIVIFPHKKLLFFHYNLVQIGGGWECISCICQLQNLWAPCRIYRSPGHTYMNCCDPGPIFEIKCQIWETVCINPCSVHIIHSIVYSFTLECLYMGWGCAWVSLALWSSFLPLAPQSGVFYHSLSKTFPRAKQLSPKTASWGPTKTFQCPWLEGGGAFEVVTISKICTS